MRAGTGERGKRIGLKGMGRDRWRRKQNWREERIGRRESGAVAECGGVSPAHCLLLLTRFSPVSLKQQYVSPVGKKGMLCAKMVGSAAACFCPLPVHHI